MKRLKSYFFTNSNLNSRGKYISLKDNAEPNETLFNDLLDSVVKPKVGADYQDQADFNAVNTKDSSKFVTAENLPEVDSSGSLLTITTTAAVDTNLLRRKKYTVSANTPSIISDISSRLTTKLVTPANLPKFALDNSEYTQVASQLPYFAPSVVVTTDGVDFYQTYSLKLRALESTMMTHAGVRLDTVLDGLRTDVNACVSDSELTSAVNSLNLAINNKATKVSPNFVAGYNGTKVTVNSQGIVTTVTKASASDITNDSSVSGSTVKDALNWLKANGGGTGGASDTDGVTNLSDVPGGTATDALNNLSDSIAAIVPFISSDVEINSSNTSGWTTPTFNVSPLVNYRVAPQGANIELVLPSYTSADLNKVILVYKGFDDTRVTTFTGYSVILSKRGDCVGFICTSVGWLPFTTSVDWSANLALKADINSPTFTGIPVGPTASPGTNTTQLATTAFVTTALSSFVGGATYQSTWDASTNTPTLASGVGTKGYYYVVSVDGSTNLDSVTDWKVGDWVIYNGTAWQKVDNTDAISSFNGSLGAITYTPTGTANRVTITGASGLTPTFDIASTYAGQTSITTLGTIATGVWQGTAVADAYIASAATWNAKLGPSGGTLTGALNYAPSVTLASATTVNIGSANSNNIIITGTTTINAFDTVAEGITKVLKFSGSLILQVPNLPNGNIIVTQNGDLCTVRSNGTTWDFVNYQRKTELITRDFVNSVTYTENPVNIGGNILKNSVALVAPFDNNFQRPIFVTRKNATTSGRTIMRFMGTQTNDVNGIWIQHNDMARTPNGSFNIMNCESSSSSVLIGVGADVNSATQTLQVFQGGVAISSSAFGSTATINASAQLDLQSTTKGLGLNLVAGDLGTTRNGLIWYDTVGNLFKGVQNGGVVSLLTGSGLTTNTIPRANAGALQDSYITEITTNAGGSVGATRPYPSVLTVPGGTGAGQSGFLKWVDNGSNTGELYIYKPYTNGQGPGWYQILTNQNTAFPVLSTSSPAIGMGLSTMTNSTSTAPTNLYTGEIRNLRVGSQLYGLGVFQADAGFHYLKPFGGNHWEFTVAVNSYMRDWDWEVIGATANSGKGGGSNTLSNLSKIGNSTVKFRAMANANSPYYYIEGVFKVNSSGAITSLVITQPSSNTTAFNASITDTRIQFTGNAFSLAYVICEKIAGQYYGALYTTPYENERYSADATVKYWVGDLALGSSTINSRAQLELQSTSKGFLPNKLTTTERDAVSWVSGDAGMIIYNSTTNKHQGWNGTTWNDLY